MRIDGCGCLDRRSGEKSVRYYTAAAVVLDPVEPLIVRSEVDEVFRVYDRRALYFLGGSEGPEHEGGGAVGPGEGRGGVVQRVPPVHGPGRGELQQRRFSGEVDSGGTRGRLR